MSNQRLDQFADAIAQARATGTFGEFESGERSLLDLLSNIAPELDATTVGAAWLVIGNVFRDNLERTEPDLQGDGAIRLVNLLQLAGQRLYAGAPLTHPCPIPRSNGTACRFTAKGGRQEVLDAMMRAHVDVYHPGRAWPPEVISDSAHPDRNSGLEDLRANPAFVPIEGVEETAYCACGRPAELTVGTVNKPDGQPGDVKALCFACHRDADDTTWIERAPGRPVPAPRCVGCKQPLGLNGAEWQPTRIGPMCQTCFKAWSAAAESGRLLEAAIEKRAAAETVGRCRTCQTPVSVVGPPIAAKGYVDEDGLKCADHVQVEDVDLEAEPLARSYTLDEAMAHPGGIDALTGGAIRHVGFSVEGDEDDD